MFISSPGFAFDLYGCWKSNQSDRRLYGIHVLKFDQDRYYYGENSLPAKFTEKGDAQIVTFFKTSEIILKKVDDNTIKATFPDPGLPQDILYTRITDEERDQIINKKKRY